MEQKITDLLKEIREEVLLIRDGEFTEDKKDYFLDRFWEFYNQNKRHTYHEITLFIIQVYNGQSREKEYEEVSVITEKIKELIDRAEEHCKCIKGRFECSKNDPPLFIECENASSVDLTCYEYKQLENYLYILYDHMLLEMTRLTQIKKENERVSQSTRSLRIAIMRNNARQRSLDVKFNETNETIENYKAESDCFKAEYDLFKKEFKTQTTKLEESTKNLEESSKDFYVQLVSILGIFAAIVVAVFGGLNVISTISTSFLKGDLSSYRTLFASSLSIFFTFNF